MTGKRTDRNAWAVWWPIGAEALTPRMIETHGRLHDKIMADPSTPRYVADMWLQTCFNTPVSRN